MLLLSIIILQLYICREGSENFGVWHQIHLDVSVSLRLLLYLWFVIRLVAVRMKKARLEADKGKIPVTDEYVESLWFRERDRENQILFILVIGKKVLVSVAGYVGISILLLLVIIPIVYRPSLLRLNLTDQLDMSVLVNDFKKMVVRM